MNKMNTDNAMIIRRWAGSDDDDDDGSGVPTKMMVCFEL